MGCGLAFTPFKSFGAAGPHWPLHWPLHWPALGATLRFAPGLRGAFQPPTPVPGFPPEDIWQRGRCGQ